MIYYVGEQRNDIINVSIKQAKEYLSKQAVLGLDIETTSILDGTSIYQGGLDPYLSKIVMLQIGTLEHQYIINTRVINPSSLFNDDTIYVGHNIKFEGKFLLHEYGIHLNNVYDTMIVEQVLTNGYNLKYSLEALTHRYLDKSSYNKINLFEEYNPEKDYLDKLTRLGFLTIGDKPFSKKQIDYGKDDIIYPLQIRELQMAKKGFPTNCVKIENKFTQVLASIEYNGMIFNPEKWSEIYNNKLPLYYKLKEKLDNYVVNNYPVFVDAVDLFNNKARCAISWTSSDQVIQLFRHIGFCPKEKSKETGRMEYTVGSKSLSKLLKGEYKELFFKKTEVEIENEFTLILEYLRFKKLEQATTTFGKQWLKYVHPITKRVHSNYKQIMNTGRVSSSKPNLQNIPSEEVYRKCFIAGENQKVINADYSAQEIRILADVTNDPNMIDFFVNGNETFGDDFHSFTATKMYKIIYNDPEFICNKKTHPDERNNAKAINFKINYGGSAFTLKDDFGVSEEEAEKFITAFFNAFPTLKENFEVVKRQAVKNGYINIDSTGRIYYFNRFNEMKEAKETALGIYPKDWRNYSDEEKQKFKDDNPQLKELWSLYYTLKGMLERAALNYRKFAA